MLVGLSIANAQTYLPKYPYEPLSFVDFEPIWYHTYIDSTVIGDTTDGYNYVTKPLHNVDIIHNDFLYTLVYGRALSSEFTRSYVSKINLWTGEVIWSNAYGLGIDNGKMEAGRLMYFNNEDNLEIIGLLNAVDYDLGTVDVGNGAFNLFMTKRILDSKNGSLIDLQLPDISDSTLVRGTYVATTRLNEFFQVGDSLQSFRKLNNVNRNFVEISTRKFDSKSHEIFIDTIVRPFGIISGIDETNPVQLDDTTYLYVGWTDVSKVTFHTINHRGHDVDIVMGDSVASSANSGKLLRVAKDKQSFLISYNVSVPNSFNSRKDLIVVDRRGNIIHKAELPVNYQVHNILDWNEEDNSLVVIGPKWYKDEKQGALEVLYFDEHGVLSLAQSYLFNDTRYPNNISSTKINDEFYLLKLNEGNVEVFNDGSLIADHSAGAVSHMLVDAEDFSVKHVNTKQPYILDQINVYPNPASDYLHINFPFEYSGLILLLDLNGKTIFTKELDNNLQAFFDLHLLQSGMYVIHIVDQFGHSFNQLVMKE